MTFAMDTRLIILALLIVNDLQRIDAFHVFALILFLDLVGQINDDMFATVVNKTNDCKDQKQYFCCGFERLYGENALLTLFNWGLVHWNHYLIK